MKIRPLTMTDLAEVIQYGIEQKERTVYKGLPESRAAIAYAFRRAMSMATEQCLVADNGRIVGFILLSAMNYWWADPRSGPRFVTDLAFFSSVYGGGVQLLDGAIAWSKTIPRVVEFTSQHSSGTHRRTIDRVYRGAGMTKLGDSYWIRFDDNAEEVAA